VNPDEAANFYDFQPFGGWTEPLMKTFNSDVTICSVFGDETYFYQPAYEADWNPAYYQGSAGPGYYPKQSNPEYGSGY